MASAAAGRPGEMTDAELKAAIKGSTQWQWELGKTIFLKNLPADRYIISVKSQITWAGNYNTGSMSGCGKRYQVYLIDNYGQVHEFSSPETIYSSSQINFDFSLGGHVGGIAYCLSRISEPGFEVPLTSAEIDMIKDMPLYDFPFAKKFRGHIARICGGGDGGGKPSHSPPSAPPEEAMASGGAAAAAVVEEQYPMSNDPVNPKTGGRRLAKRNHKKTRKRLVKRK